LIILCYIAKSGFGCDNDSLCDKVLEDLIHHSLEGGWTIGETKVQHKWLKEAAICVEGCLPLVALSDTDIIVSPVHVELGKVAHTLEVMD
jgi:hypothetical protein